MLSLYVFFFKFHLEDHAGQLPENFLDALRAGR